MTTEKIELIRIIAEPGKVFMRIFDNKIFGSEVILGYTYYVGGVLLDIPLKELPEYYIEIDVPTELIEAK